MFVDEPNNPKTKPPIATAAMSVTAMISTVAMIGDMALVCFPWKRAFFMLKTCFESKLINGCGFRIRFPAPLDSPPGGNRFFSRFGREFIEGPETMVVPIPEATENGKVSRAGTIRARTAS